MPVPVHIYYVSCVCGHVGDFWREFLWEWQYLYTDVHSLLTLVLISKDKPAFSLTRTLKFCSKGPMSGALKEKTMNVCVLYTVLISVRTMHTMRSHTECSPS